MARKKKRQAAPAADPLTTAPFDYELGELNRELGQRGKQFGKEKRSIKGAVGMTLGALQAAQVPAALRGTPEGRQLKQEYRGRIKDSRRSVPGLMAAAQSEYKADRADIQSSIRGTQFDRQQAVNEELAAALADQQEAQAEKRKEFGTPEFQFALEKGRTLIADIPKEDLPGLDPNETWGRLANELAKDEAIRPEVARKVAQKLVRRIGAVHRSETRKRTTDAIANAFEGF